MSNVVKFPATPTWVTAVDAAMLDRLTSYGLGGRSLRGLAVGPEAFGACALLP